ncbi:MAG: HD-GYP domain-containing protein [Cetobacterium sp.]
MIKFKKIFSKLNWFKRKTKVNILDEYNLDFEIKEHLIRVSNYSEILADLMCLSTFDIKNIKTGALFHDIGKKKICEKILNKKSKLTDEEFEEIKKHPELGLKIANTKNLKVKNIILYHHEKWNGKGYPKGLKEKNIPIEARIVSVADCYDALTSNRVYKEKLSHEEAMQILISENGKSFDPDIIFMLQLFEEKFEIELYKNNLKN